LLGRAAFDTQEQLGNWKPPKKALALIQQSQIEGRL
jgi:hypothetical protein